jgi:tetratricopeptide (TPR) repeat protein
MRNPANVLRSTLVLMMLSGSVYASQPSSVSSSSTVSDAESSDRSRIELSDQLPWLLRRSALLDLRLHESPSPQDYELTSILLGIGLELDPTNAEIARDMAQAAWLAGDEKLMYDATRQIIRIDPKDTVAQLRLISSRINEKQTLEGRKALYDRFLSDAGKSLDPSVRSRLALDAALLEREAGNTSGFIERLHQATRLDRSNKSAASLAVQYYASINPDPTTNLDYQLRLLYADPLDANVHLTIATMLARQGALQESKRFLYNAIELFKLETGRSPENIEEIRIAIEWQADGPEKPMAPLEAAINDQRRSAQVVIDAYEEQMLPTDALMQPEKIRYSLGIDKLRILAAHATGDSELVRKILDDIEGTISDEIFEFTKLARAPGANVSGLFAQVILRMSELNAIRAVVGLDADKMRDEIEEMQENLPQAAEQLGGIEPMILFAEGKYEEALVASEKFAGTVVGAIVRAQCYERIGDTEEAIRIYDILAHNNVTSAYGAFAHTRLVQLGREDLILTDRGQEMMEIVARVPDWIEDMIQRPHSFQFILIEQDEQVYHDGQRPMLTIKLQNTAPVPLSVGPNAPIDSRMLIEPTGLGSQQSGFRGRPRPRVIQMDTRLRLLPRESVTLQVTADSVSTDWLLSHQPRFSSRVRWRLIQGFRARLSDTVATQQQQSPDANVFGIKNSPLGLTAETGVVQRLGLPVYTAQASQLIDMLESADRDSNRRALTVISARMLNSASIEEEFDPSSQARIVSAINELYTRSSTETRAAMLLALPQRHQVSAMMDFDDHVASSLLSDALIESKVDPAVLACALLTRADDPESPIFETLAHVDHDGVKRLAQIVRDRLRNGVPIIGTIGPGIESMVPSFDGIEY